MSQEKLRRKPKLLAPNKTQIVRLEQTALIGHYTRASLQAAAAGCYSYLAIHK